MQSDWKDRKGRFLIHCFAARSDDDLSDLSDVDDLVPNLPL